MTKPKWQVKAEVKADFDKLKAEWKPQKMTELDVRTGQKKGGKS